MYRLITGVLAILAPFLTIATVTLQTQFKKAGNGVGSKHIGQAYTGRVMVCCKHIFTQRGLNMQAGGGEKYSYILLLVFGFFVAR